jgi:ribosome-associated toxin RatA of RatAB toxin-antitoxin module
MTEQNLESDALDLDAELDALETDSSELAGVNAELLQLVQVQTEALAGRERKISASIDISATPTNIWTVLTDYENLPDFIPNLKVSRRLDHPQGGLRLEQVGTQRFLRLNFSARVVLDLEEQCPDRIQFQMVEGDLKAYAGYWQLEALGDSPVNTRLSYSVQVTPKRTMPVALIEKRLSQDLAINLAAIRQRVIELFEA